MRDPRSSDGDDIGGDSTDKIESELDVVAAVNDLLTLAGRVGAGGQPLGGEEGQQLRNSVKNARLEVHTGTEDRLLRRLRITADLDPELPEALEELARAAGATVEFELQVANPNDPVEVEAPADARPFAELGGS